MPGLEEDEREVCDDAAVSSWDRDAGCAGGHQLEEWQRNGRAEVARYEVMRCGRGEER